MEIGKTGWWVADRYHLYGALFVIFWAFWVIFSITLHELGHGWAAIRKGDTTPIMLKRMTFNPLVHMGPTSLILFAVIGIAWGAMPVNPSRFRGKHADAFVAAAGPAVNLALFLICSVGAALVGRYTQAEGSPVADNAYMFFSLGSFLNAALLALNLLPIPPLDGSRIVASYSRPYRDMIEGPNAAMYATVAVIFVFFAAGEIVFGGARLASDWVIFQIAVLLP